MGFPFEEGQREEGEKGQEGGLGWLCFECRGSWVYFIRYRFPGVFFCYLYITYSIITLGTQFRNPYLLRQPHYI